MAIDFNFTNGQRLDETLPLSSSASCFAFKFSRVCDSTAIIWGPSLADKQLTRFSLHFQMHGGAICRMHVTGDNHALLLA